MSERAYKVALPPSRCERIGCRRPASHTVFDSHGYRLGDYCEPHADERIDSLSNYYGAIEAR